MDENRKKALVAALGQIERQFGKNSLLKNKNSLVAKKIFTILDEHYGKLRGPLNYKQVCQLNQK